MSDTCHSSFITIFPRRTALCFPFTALQSWGHTCVHQGVLYVPLRVILCGYHVSAASTQAQAIRSPRFSAIFFSGYRFHWLGVTASCDSLLLFNAQCLSLLSCQYGSMPSSIVSLSSRPT